MKILSKQGDLLIVELEAHEEDNPRPKSDKVCTECGQEFLRPFCLSNPCLFCGGKLQMIV